MTLSAVELELFANRLTSVSEEMGLVLQSASMSPNIKERRDFSCALFDSAGDMVAHAAHIPVHLGSTPLAVRAALQSTSLEPGDVVILNDPYAGGTHLPDVTLVAPVFLPGAKRPFAYVADRAHHADIGGGKPGSMALATDIHQEGFRIPPVHLLRAAEWVTETRVLFLANTRVAEERLGDLEAQVAALRAGITRTLDLVDRFSAKRVALAMRELQAYSHRLVDAMLTAFPRGRWSGEDLLDDDGAGTRDIAVRVEIQRRGRTLEFDFRASDDQVRGPVNANLAITTSAVFYAIACVAGHDVPANSGMMKPVRIRTRPGSIVDCLFPSAVAGGNVETSQRIVDVVLRALARALPDRIPAASCGTMNNLALGGYDPFRRRHYSYYETIGGGCGAGPLRDGASAMQTHMTNTWNTPVEALEAYYPLRVHRYAVRRGSGGSGEHRGGDGIIREVEVLADCEVTLLAERRRRGPWGLGAAGAASAAGAARAAGAVGAAGAATAVSATGAASAVKDGKAGTDETVDVRGRRRRIESKSSLELKAGERIVIATPGGGGWSAGAREKTASAARGKKRPRRANKKRA